MKPPLMVRLGVAAALALGPAGCAPPAGEKPRPFTVVLGGDTGGFIVPCGCASKQLGGLPRRASFLKRFGPGEALHLDAGNGLARAFDYDRLKGEHLWRGLGLMGVAAANLGAGEVAQGREFLEARKAVLPFVSANVLREDGSPLVPSHVLLRIAGARVAVLGICSARYPAGPGLRVEDPLEALRGPVARLRGETDLLFLLAQAPEEELIALAGAFPELDAVLATGQGQPIPPRMVEGRTVLAGTSNKGKFLALVPWAPSADRRVRWSAGEGRIAELDDAIPDDPGQAALVKDLQKALRAAALPPEKTGETSKLLTGLPRESRHAGSEACLKCHESAGRIWKASKHAHGLETLGGKGFEADPYCVRCHTTGYGGAGGYRGLAETPLLGGVGCEGCHGPSQAHVEDAAKVKTPLRAAEACLSCHDPENSPAFTYASYWPNVLHGKDRPADGPQGGEGRR